MQKTIFSLAITLVLAASALTSSAQTGEPIPPNSIVGTWYVDATPDGPPPFKGLITFGQGGTVIASAQADILQNAGSLATAGHGAWTRTGNREFVFTFRQILYNADGEYDGGVVVRHNAVLGKDGNTWEGRLTVEFYNANDAVVATGTGGGSARRIVAEGPQ